MEEDHVASYTIGIFGAKNDIAREISHVTAEFLTIGESGDCAIFQCCSISISCARMIIFERSSEGDGGAIDALDDWLFPLARIFQFIQIGWVRLIRIRNHQRIPHFPSRNRSNKRHCLRPLRKLSCNSMERIFLFSMHRDTAKDNESLAVLLGIKTGTCNGTHLEWGIGEDDFCIDVLWDGLRCCSDGERSLWHHHEVTDHELCIAICGKDEGSLDLHTVEFRCALCIVGDRCIRSILYLGISTS